MASTELPAANTDEGAMARLFIAESDVNLADTAAVFQGMSWMRLVLANRLARPGPFGSPGATRMTQIITSKRFGDQFEGFTNYPTISGPQALNISDKVRFARDA